MGQSSAKFDVQAVHSGYIELYLAREVEKRN